MKEKSATKRDKTATNRSRREALRRHTDGQLKQVRGGNETPPGSDPLATRVIMPNHNAKLLEI